LNDQGYPELAALAIDARLQGDVLVLQGIVHLDIQRRDLLEITAAIPGVREINAVDLLLRPQPTYVVQEGDTLWSIVYNIYGDVEMLDEFAAYNQAILPSPDALAQGLELKVLPVQ
jgi:nucleoid-associated protein YgaU